MSRDYLLSMPERIVRSLLGLGAGVVREAGTIALPEAVRRSQLYQNLVDATLRFFIEQIGGIEGVYDNSDKLTDDFLARRTAGNAIEIAGIVAFRASPVWILAALADLSGFGRYLIPEIAESLKAEGLLDKDAQFSSMDQLLDGLERTSGRMASMINAPPLDVQALRSEWTLLRADAGRLPGVRLPPRDTLTTLWADLKAEASRQQRTIFETSSLMGLSAVCAIPDGARWLSASTRAGATRAGQVIAAALLDHYQRTLHTIGEIGYLEYARRQLRPYVVAAAAQFSPNRATVTERFLRRLRTNRLA
ncbi:MAG TPA: hypothetical protein VJP86_12855 [Vicinamibacterales bacterium]|jgi:hypothetical protein|nr:hypothetical protein [Vicinamibacterales bacterium]